MSKKFELSQSTKDSLIDDLAATLRDKSVTIKARTLRVGGKATGLLIHKDLGIGDVVINLKVGEVYLQERSKP